MGDVGKHFNKAEFACKCGCKTEFQMDKKLVEKLDELREVLNKPIVIVSGFRCPEHNKKCGGVKGSAHMLGLAVDIACEDSGSRFSLMSLLFLLGFKRIGIGASFIHVDLDSSKPQWVLWDYPRKGDIKNG